MEYAERALRINQLRSRIREPTRKTEADPWWSWIFDADRSFSTIKSLSIVGLIISGLTALVGSYFQYTIGREEKKSTIFREDYGTANSTLTEIVTALTAVNTPASLIFYIQGCKGSDTYQSRLQFLWDTAHAAHDEYVQARMGVRKNKDIFATKATIHIDWPALTDTDTQKGLQAQESIGMAKVERNYDCDKQLAAGKDINDLVHREELRLSYQVSAIHYCSEILHKHLFTQRLWAAGTIQWKDLPDKRIEHYRQILDLFNTQIERLATFVQFGTVRLGQIRAKYSTKNFVCHTLEVWCG